MRSQKYDIEDSVVAGKLLSGGTRGAMGGQQVAEDAFNAGSSDYDLG